MRSSTGAVLADISTVSVVAASIHTLVARDIEINLSHNSTELSYLVPVSKQFMFTGVNAYKLKIPSKSAHTLL